jgi:DNA-binding transcriptional MerR regulator
MEYLTTSRVARELECSEAAIRKLADAGTLPVAAKLADGTRLFDPFAVSQAKRDREGRRAGVSSPAAVGVPAA